MTYVPAADRYERCPTAAAAGAGSSCPPSRSGSGTTSAAIGRSRRSARSSAARSTSGITHFDLANNYGPPYGSAEENFGRLLRRRLPALPRRARDLDQGRLRHVAGAVRRVGLAQVSAREPRPEPAADGARLRRHLLLAPLRPGHAARGDDGRARHGRAAGARRSTPASRRTRPSRHAEAARDPARARHAAPDPPAVVLDDQPLDRGRAARRARAGGRRLHRVLAARRRAAHRQVPRRDPGGLAREPRIAPLAGSARRGDARQGARAERDRGGSRPVAGPAGDRLGASRRARHLGADRRVAASSSSRRTWPRSTASASPTTSLPRSTVTRPRATSTSGSPPRTADRSAVGPGAAESEGAPPT